MNRSSMLGLGRNRTGRALAPAGCVAVAWLAGACGEPDAVEITEERVASKPSAPVLPGATSEERFGRPAQPEGQQGSGATLDDLTFAYDLPEGWVALEPTSLRRVNLRPAGDPDAECYVTLLTGGGGLAANVDRWRGQMGLEPLAAGEAEALPKRPLLGIEATELDLAGTFRGMGGGPGREGWRMLGVIAAGPQNMLFVKLTGPAAIVEAERERYEAFLDSLRPAKPAEPAPAAPPASPADAEDAGETVALGPAEEGGGLRWRAPEGWEREGPRPMRTVSYTFGGGAECYVSVLGGDGGGLVPNLDRWSKQLGGPGVDAAGVAALPRVSLLGQDCAVLSVEGTYTSMGGDVNEGYALLGAAHIAPGGSVFVKMIGPAAEVAAAHAEFEAFCRSLEEAR